MTGFRLPTWILVSFTGLLGLAPKLVMSQATVPTGWEVGTTGTQVSLRGLHAVDDKIIWASGATASVLRTRDGGDTWHHCGPRDFGELEFRCVHAWDAQTACIASAGTPAVLLRTEDAGQSWQETYRCEAPTAFFDAMRFWDARRGIAVSDPVDGHLLIVETHDGGRSWSPLSAGLPPAREGEAAFAASNSALCLGKGGQVWFGTGGATAPQSRLYARNGWQKPWTTLDLPLASAAEQGIFSICQGPLATDQAAPMLVAVGGDYRPGETSATVACYSKDDGVSWSEASVQPSAYRSAVCCLPQDSKFVGYVTVGPSGSDFSADAIRWQPLSERGFHALAVGKTRVFACGSDGRFAVLR